MMMIGYYWGSCKRVICTRIVYAAALITLKGIIKGDKRKGYHLAPEILLLCAVI